jgi:hypothetical protein
MPYVTVTRAITLQYARHRHMVTYRNHSGRRAVELHVVFLLFFLLAARFSARIALCSASSVASD